MHKLGTRRLTVSGTLFCLYFWPSKEPFQGASFGLEKTQIQQTLKYRTRAISGRSRLVATPLSRGLSKAGFLAEAEAVAEGDENFGLRLKTKAKAEGGK